MTIKSIRFHFKESRKLQRTFANGDSFIKYFKFCLTLHISLIVIQPNDNINNNITRIRTHAWLVAAMEGHGIEIYY